MKKLIIINGTMGVGKTTTCKKLYHRLDNSVWLDGDWCWMMNPFVVLEENKRMVEDNITYLLNNFLSNSQFEYIIFNWVIHKEEIFDLITDKLKGNDFELYKITLICTEDELERRMLIDNRDDELIKCSIERLKLYKSMNSIKIDTSNITIDETVNKVLEVLK